MIEKIVNYEELVKKGCLFAPQAGFAYSHLNDKPVGTLYIFSCLGVYLKQKEVQIVAHLDFDKRIHLSQMLDYLYKKKVITNGSFDKACLIKSEKTNELTFQKSFDYLTSFIDDVQVLQKNYSPVNFAFDEFGKFYKINMAEGKMYSIMEVVDLLMKRLSRHELICANEAIEHKSFPSNFLKKLE
ncbi:MAG: hypothetical protein WC376_04325 [Candidatus Nanoarchaeia archaeon]|jgi:hypothetical protein